MRACGENLRRVHFGIQVYLDLSVVISSSMLSGRYWESTFSRLNHSTIEMPLLYFSILEIGTIAIVLIVVMLESSCACPAQ
jgi:hypothetical protein